MKNRYNAYRQICLLLILVLLCVAQHLSAQIITTVAGNGPPGGYSTDGVPATSTQIWYPYTVAADAFGNFYLSNWTGSGSYARVRKVDPSGIITTCAGNGSPGFSGDGGPATAAQIQWGGGVACDTFGNYYIMDWGNS